MDFKKNSQYKKRTLKKMTEQGLIEHVGYLIENSYNILISNITGGISRQALSRIIYYEII